MEEALVFVATFLLIFSLFLLVLLFYLIRIFIKKLGVLENQANHYREKSSQYEDWLRLIYTHKSIPNYFKNKKWNRVCIYGAGVAGGFLLKALEEGGIAIDSIIDPDSQYQVFHKYPVKKNGSKVVADVVVVTELAETGKVVYELERTGLNCPIFVLDELLNLINVELLTKKKN